MYSFSYSERHWNVWILHSFVIVFYTVQTISELSNTVSQHLILAFLKVIKLYDVDLKF